MTDQELRDLVESVAKLQAETARQMAETDRRLAETDRILKESAEKAEEERRKREEELAEERRKTEEVQRRLAEELAEERRKTEEERRETERVIRQVNKQLGELGNKFGSFTEGLALPSMEKILHNQFKMNVVTPRAKGYLNGRTLEIDVLAYDDGARNEAYLVEVKSHLTPEGIEQMLKTIEQFPKFFRPHRDRTIYGVIAAVQIPDNLRAEVMKKGLYLARIHDGEFELLTPRGFKPTPFAPATRQNGKSGSGQKRSRRK